MPVYQTRHQSAYEADFLFDLVADIQSYPEFLPACESAEILEKAKISKKDSEEFVGRLTLGHSLLPTFSFTSRVRLDRKNKTIHAHSKEGTLRNLNCHWQFQDLDQNGCVINFSLSFEFRSRLLAQLATPLLDHAASRLVESFIQRADHLAPHQEQAIKPRPCS